MNILASIFPFIKVKQQINVIRKKKTEYFKPIIIQNIFFKENKSKVCIQSYAIMLKYEVHYPYSLFLCTSQIKITDDNSFSMSLPSSTFYLKKIEYWKIILNYFLALLLKLCYENKITFRKLSKVYQQLFEKYNKEWKYDMYFIHRSLYLIANMTAQVNN